MLVRSRQRPDNRSPIPRISLGCPRVVSTIHLVNIRPSTTSTGSFLVSSLDHLVSVCRVPCLSETMVDPFRSRKWFVICILTKENVSAGDRCDQESIRCVWGEIHRRNSNGASHTVSRRIAVLFDPPLILTNDRIMSLIVLKRFSSAGSIDSQMSCFCSTGALRISL